MCVCILLFQHTDSHMPSSDDLPQLEGCMLVIQGMYESYR